MRLFKNDAIAQMQLLRLQQTSWEERSSVLN